MSDVSRIQHQILASTTRGRDKGMQKSIQGPSMVSMQGGHRIAGTRLRDCGVDGNGLFHLLSRVPNLSYPWSLYIAYSAVPVGSITADF